MAPPRPSPAGSSIACSGKRAPADRLLEALLVQAFARGDRHSHHPADEERPVRFRVNGNTHDLPDLPKAMSLPVISWVKDMANIDSSIRGIPRKAVRRTGWRQGAERAGLHHPGVNGEN